MSQLGEQTPFLNGAGLATDIAYASQPSQALVPYTGGMETAQSPATLHPAQLPYLVHPEATVPPLHVEPVQVSLPPEFQGHSGYNPSGPMPHRGQQIRLLRVEPHARNNEYSCLVAMDETWQPVADVDPFIEHQDAHYVGQLGGRNAFVAVKVDYDSVGKVRGYRDVCYVYDDDITQATTLFEAPQGYKDTLLHQLPDGRVLVMARPQGGVAGPGVIVPFIVDCPEEVGPALRELDDALKQDKPFQGKQIADLILGGLTPRTPGNEFGEPAEVSDWKRPWFGGDYIMSGPRPGTVVLGYHFAQFLPFRDGTQSSIRSYVSCVTIYDYEKGEVAAEPHILATANHQAIWRDALPKFETIAGGVTFIRYVELMPDGTLYADGGVNDSGVARFTLLPPDWLRASAELQREGVALGALALAAAEE